MLHTVKGLVLRENIVNSNLRYINLFCSELGQVSVLVRGAVKLQNRFSSSTKIFCYGEFVIYEKDGRYTLNDASLIENYFNLCEDYDIMMIGTYVLNTVEYVTNTAQSDPEILRLALNTLWALVNRREKNPRLIKGAYEMRLARLSGLAPNVVNCRVCGHGVENEPMLLNVMGGTMICRKCSERVHTTTYIENDRVVDRMNTAQIIMPMAPATVLAIQHALYANMSKLFSFNLADELLPEFSAVCEKYLENHVDHHFSVLDMMTN